MEFPLLISSCPALILGKIQKEFYQQTFYYLLFWNSRVPLATLSSNSENIISVDTPTSSGDLSLGYALKLPSQFQTEASSSFMSSPTTPTSSHSPNSQKSRRKQTLSWKKPRMRDSWSKWVPFMILLFLSQVDWPNSSARVVLIILSSHSIFLRMN